MWWNKKADKTTQTGGNFTNPNGNSQIPLKLRGIHPSANSFWNTAEFFVRLGEECAKNSNNQFVCQFFIKPNGEFSCNFFDIDSAKALFPSLGSDLQSQFNGSDTQIIHTIYTSAKICEIVQEDGPSAYVEGSDYSDGKSISVRWH